MAFNSIFTKFYTSSFDFFNIDLLAFTKALKGSSLGQMYRKKNVPGLTDKMNERLQKMLQYKGDA